MDEKSSINIVERLDLEIGSAISRLLSLGFDQSSINTIQLAGLAKTLMDKGIISEHEYGEHVISQLREVERLAEKQIIIRGRN